MLFMTNFSISVGQILEEANLRLEESRYICRESIYLSLKQSPKAETA